MRFAVHWPGSPVASPRSHGVPSRDVPSCVQVSIADEAAGRAGEARLALARLRIHAPARRASLARKMRLYPLDPSARLILQPAHQQAPSRPQDLAVESGLGTDVPAGIPRRPPGRAGHISDLQVLDVDHVESAGDIRGYLLHPVLTPVGLPSTEPGYGMLYPRAAVRTALTPGELAFQAPHTPLLPHGQAGSVQQFAGGQCRGYGHAAVDAYGLAVTRCGNGSWNGGEGDMPSLRTVHGDPIRPCASGYLARPAESHPASFGYPDCAGLPAQPTHLLRLDGDDSEPLVAACLPPRGSPSRVFWIQGSCPGLREVSQRLLLHHLGALREPRELCAGGGELPALLQVARPTRAARAPVRVLLDRKIPHVPGVAAVVPQDDLLRGRRNQPIPRHTNTLSETTDISEEVKRRRLPRVTAGEATPRSS